MFSPQPLPKKSACEPALDHQQLYAIGLQYVQKLSNRIWTDYNLHDPGVTTLELLCYALTDLGYRASYPIQDLLASEKDNAANMGQQFFSARRILPNRSLTLLDYRKLLIDLPGVKNAWLIPSKITYYADTSAGLLSLTNPTPEPWIKKVNVAGLYDVSIEYEDGAVEKDVLELVKQQLQNNRNLCEDFVGFSKVEEQPFNLCGELELAPNANVVEVKAKILFQVEQYLAPPVGSYSLDEMLERKKADGTSYAADEIFDGPALNHGFIDNDELKKAELRKEIRLSDIINIIMDIEGVVAVRDLVINAATGCPECKPIQPENKWLVPVENGKRATLCSNKTRFVFYKRNMPVVPDEALVTTRFQQLTSASRLKREDTPRLDFDIPLGTYRKTDSYYSFQNHFPAVYGLSEMGLSSAEGEKRQALAYQLKAYLLFFDQVMANYFAQLSHVKELFSTDPDLHRTYYYQAVDSFADYSKIYGTADVVKTMQDEVEDGKVLIERRNRFLDHLIARFAERFHDLAHAMSSAFGSSPESMVRCKCEFLKAYPEISSERSLAYNYSLNDKKNLWNSENVSGLEKRLAKLLGLSDYSRRNLGDVEYDIYAEVDTTPNDEFRFRIRNNETDKILLSSSRHFRTEEMAKAAMRRAIGFGQERSRYKTNQASDAMYYFNLLDDTNAIIARRVEYFKTAALMNLAIDETIEYLRNHYSNGGMYLIENILLRPDPGKIPDDPFLPICSANNRTSCADEDPYSYRIHIILPADEWRFENTDFRRFAEEVIREETPAHILPKICWISKADMMEFEKLYRDWIYLMAGAANENCTKDRQHILADFIDKLFRVKSVYQTAKLFGCDSGEDRAKFILGQTSLGTQQ